MEAFEYARPASGKEAVELLGSSFAESEILAGGMDLISLMKNYVLSPKRLVNIKGISEFGGIRSTPKGLAIGATVSLQELIEHKNIAAEYPGLHRAAAAAGSSCDALLRARNKGQARTGHPSADRRRPAPGGRSSRHKRPRAVCGPVRGRP